MSIANWITLVRIMLIPVFVAALIYQRLVLALAAFVLAALTDVLDGYVARRTRITTLGRFLDPMADKLLLVSAFVILPIIGAFPAWITVVVVSRDVIIALGYFWIYLHWGSGRIKVRPLGKITTFLQSFCVVLILLHMLIALQEDVSLYFAYMVALVTAASGVDYIIQGFMHVTELQDTKRT